MFPVQCTGNMYDCNIVQEHYELETWTMILLRTKITLRYEVSAFHLTHMGSFKRGRTPFLMQ